MTTIKIEKFLGLHLDSTGDTNLKIGELAECKNVRVTENYNLRKREGYTELFTSIASKNVQGMWYGKINNVFHFLFACNGHIYEHNLITHANTDLGTLTDAKTFFFAFQDNVYIMNGAEYKKWTGTGTISDVTGYVPKVAIGTPPAGGGTAFEQINLLTGAKHQTFSADGTSKDYFIAEKSVTSIDYVKVNGVLKTLTTDYTVDLVNGKVSFVTAPTTGQDNVDIGWTKGSGQRDLVYKNKKALIFGGKSDTRIHIFGNSDKKNIFYFTGLADGVPSAEYFPVNNYREVGSNEFSITDMIRQYDRAIIFKENEAWYTYYDPITVSDVVIADFPTYTLNSERGNKAFGQTQLILNNPFSIHEGVYEWISTNILDERNAKYKSDRVQLALNEINLANSITLDYKNQGEYWISVGKIAYIYSYKYDVWYKFELYDTPTCYIEIDGFVYFGTTDGRICKFSEYSIQLTDNTHVIEAKIETGFMDFGESWKRKFSNFMWVGLQPESQSKAYIEWQSDYSASQNSELISYNLIDFNNVDFSDFSFEVNYNPQPFRLKIKAKKFTWIKIIITNDSINDNMTILNIVLPALIGGISK